MGKVSGFQRLVKENFPTKYYDLVDSFYTLNNAIEQLVNIVNNAQITVADNLNQQYKTLIVTVDSTGKPLQPTTYQSTLSSKTLGIIVVAAQNLTSSTTYTTSAPFINFTDNSGTVSVNNIAGLQANQKYSLTLLCTA